MWRICFLLSEICQVENTLLFVLSDFVTFLKMYIGHQFSGKARNGTRQINKTIRQYCNRRKVLRHNFLSISCEYHFASLICKMMSPGYFIVKKTNNEEVLTLKLVITFTNFYLKFYSIMVRKNIYSSKNIYLSNRMTLAVSYNLISFHQGD